MTSVQGRSRPRRQHPSVALSDSFPPPESDDKLSDQPTRPLGANLPIAIIPAATSPVFKYTEEELQLKTVLEAQAPTSSKETRDKPLKVRFPDVYCRKFHMECYNFCQQC